MSCRLIKSPITGKEETSKTWNDIRNFVQTEAEADRLYGQLSSPEFKSWFGDWVNNPGGKDVSKVVNELGEPLLVYHGTSEEFNVFNMTSSGLTFFAENKAYAEVYARKKEENIQLLKTILKQSTEVFDALDEEKGYPWLYASIENMAKEGYSADKITNLVLNDLDLAKNFEPDYERGYIQDSGDEYADDPRYMDDNDVDYEGINNKKIEDVVIEVLGKIYASDRTLNILSDLENDVSSNEADLVRFAAKQGVETIMPGFLNIRNPQLANDISSESINEGTLKLDNTSDGLIGTDAMYYHRVGGKKEMIENEKVYAIKNANQVKSVFNVGTFGVDKGGYDNTKYGSVTTENTVAAKVAKMKELEANGAVRVQAITNGVSFYYDPNNVYFQKEGIPASAASPASIAIVKDFLNRIGVDIQTLKSINVNGETQDANGVANIMQKLVQVVEGKEAVALPEEAMHFAVEIIQQNDPKLFNQLLKEINNYAILNDVFKTYGNDKNYQTKEGKPDIIKLKKEAIAKVLSETIINKAEGTLENPENLAKVESWWEKIINAIKNLFVKTGFDEAAIKVMSGEAIGTAEDIRAEEGDVYLQKTSQQQIIDNINSIRDKIEKREDGYYIDNKKVPFRVTEIIKGWNKDLLDANQLTKSEYKQLVDEDKALNGTKGHSDIEYALGLFVDKDGNLREDPLDDLGYTSQLDPNNRDYYKLLRDNLKQRLNTFPRGTRFLSEVIVYDAKRGVAGTIDFLAITPDGKVNILDWKFIDVDIKRNKGKLPWYYINSWRNQMNQYKLILQNNYGVNVKDFDQTRMIPIRAEYTQMNLTTKEIPKIKGIEIGDVYAENIKQDYLIPLGLETETTGNKEIDDLLVKLNDEFTRLSEKGVTPSEKLNKNEQLDILFTSIRQLQMRGNLAPLLTQAKVLNRQLSNLITKYNDKFKGKDPKSFSEAEITELIEEINNAEETITIYTNLDTELDFLFGGDLSEEDKKLETELTRTAKEARKLQSQLRKLSDEFNETVTSASVDIKNLLSPEKVIKGIGKWFGSTRIFQTAAIQTLYRKANKAFAYAGFDTLDETRRLEGLKKDFDVWAKSQNLSGKNYFDIIKKKDSNELIDQYDPKFFSTLQQKINEKDVDWIRDNVDVEAYKAALEEKIAEEQLRIENKMSSRVGTDVENLEAEADEISQMRRKYDISNKTGAGWFQYILINKHPKADLETAEWKKLQSVPAAKAFYEYIQEKNKEYAEIGYINKGDVRTFLPFVRKGIMEKIVFGGKISVGEQLIRSITVDEGDIGFGKFNPITGQPINTIPRYFTREIDGEVSTDLFRTMSLYNEMAIKYKYLSELEEQAIGILNTERNKKAIATSVFGKTQKNEAGDLVYTPDNSENTKLYEDMMKAIIYGQKYVTSDSFDQILGKFGNYGEKINQKIGRKIFPENLEGKQISFNKVVSNLNTQFQITALGLNFLSAASNYFGGNAQSIINSGKYFTKADYLRNQAWILPGKMIGGDKKKYIAALEYFLPLNENYNAEIAKLLSVNKLTQERIQDFLMILMRSSDLNVQTTNFYSFLDNSIVQNGEVVNAREYLRNTDEYSNMFAGTNEERKARNEKFEKDVKDLIEEKGIMKSAELVDGKLVIPGVERKSESVVKLRRNVQALTKNALGSLGPDDIRPINQTIYGASMMLFKNWIPGLVDVRLGNLKYNSASDAYEWGRMRMMYRVVSNDFLGSLDSLQSAIRGNGDKWVAQMRTLHEKKAADYKADTGKDLKMTEGEFLNLVNQNVKSQLLDVMFFASMWALAMGLKAFAPDDKEDLAVRNKYKYLMKAVDKFKDEITYFYDPTSILSLTSKGIFPAVGLIENMRKVVVNGGKELFYLYEGDEKAIKKNFVLKYAMKSFPIGSQIGAYLPMFFPEMAKELGIKAQSQAGYGK